MQQQDKPAILVVIAGLSAATVTGFLRQAAIAFAIGAGRSADIFLVAFAIPEFVFVALPIVLAPAFIPPFIACRVQAGERSAWRFGMRVAVGLFCFMLSLTAVAGLAAPLYMRWLAPGFTPAELGGSLAALRLMLPALSLMGLAVLGSSALQAYRRFAAPSLLTAVYNLVFILTLVVAPFAWPVARASWGVTIGAAAALLLQFSLLSRLRPSSPGRSPESETEPALPVRPRLVAQLALPLAAGYAVHHLILLVDRAIATGLGAGTVAALNYADHLALVLGQLSGLAVSTVIFPELAEQLNRGQREHARATLASALALVWVIALPATVALIVLREPVVRVLFQRGAFDSAATAAVSGPLAFYAVATLADALCQPLWRVVYAQRRAGTVLAVNGLQTAIRIAADIVLSANLGYIGLAMSAALGLSVQLVVLGWLVQRRLGNFLTGELRSSARRAAFATAVTVLPAALLTRQLVAVHPLLAVSACAGGALVFAILQFPSLLGGGYVASGTSRFFGKK